jgi:hypothetical protein
LENIPVGNGSKPGYFSGIGLFGISALVHKIKIDRWIVEGAEDVALNKIEIVPHIYRIPQKYIVGHHYLHIPKGRGNIARYLNNVALVKAYQALGLVKGRIVDKTGMKAQIAMHLHIARMVQAGLGV